MEERIFKYFHDVSMLFGVALGVVTLVYDVYV